MKSLLILFLFALGFTSLQANAQADIRPDGSRKIITITTAYRGAADTIVLAPNAATTDIKHTTTLSGSGAIIFLRDSVSISLTSKYAKNKDEAQVFLRTDTARIVKFYGTAMKLPTADNRFTLAANKWYNISFVYDGVFWQKQFSTVSP